MRGGQRRAGHRPAHGEGILPGRIRNGIRLINDAGDNWLGPASGVPIASNAATLSNSFCTVQVSGAGASLSGNNMTVSVSATVRSNFTGVRPKFLQAWT